MYQKVTPKEITTEDLQIHRVDSVLTEAYIVYLDVPLSSLQRKEVGLLMSLNISEAGLYEAALCASGLQILEVEDGRAIVSAVVGVGYIRMFRMELIEAEDVYIVQDYEDRGLQIPVQDQYNVDETFTSIERMETKENGV